MAATNNASANSRDGPRKCKECNITLPDIYAYADHLESKEHKKGVMKNKYGKKYLEAKAILDGEKTKETVLERESSEDEEDDAVYTCDVCKKICTGLLSYNLHLSGKKHQKNVQRSKLMKQLQKDKVIPENNDPSDDDQLVTGLFSDKDSLTDILCKTCNKRCPGPKAYKQHTEGESHKKKLTKQKLLKDMGFEKESEEDSENEEIMKCHVCDKEFSGVIPYKQHMKSQTHLKQVKQSDQLTGIKDLVITPQDDDDKRLQCKECNKFFSGPKPFHDHLKSSLHSKMKKKNDLLNTLKEKHPEMVIMSSSPTENSDSEEDDPIIACTVCHAAFTGPESAKDHFQSQKHKKVLKEKRRYENYKQLKNGNNSGSKLKSDSSNKVLKVEENESSDDFDIIG